MDKKKEKQYKLSFVNKGKPFIINKWTVTKHKEVLKKVAAVEEKNPKITDEEKDEVFQDELILVGLIEIDSSVTMEMFEEMHPQDKKALFTAVYFSGREGITVSDKKDAGNFQK